MNIWEKRFRRWPLAKVPWPNEEAVLEAELDFQDATGIWLRDFSEKQQRRYEAVSTALKRFNHLNIRHHFARGYLLGKQDAMDGDGREHPKTEDAE